MVNKEYEENWKEKISVETIDDIDELTLGKFRKKASNCGRWGGGNTESIWADKSTLFQNRNL